MCEYWNDDNNQRWKGEKNKTKKIIQRPQGVKVFAAKIGGKDQNLRAEQLNHFVGDPLK